jgi:hypothetical protein
MIVDVSASSPGELLRQPAGERFLLGRQVWGFGGVHGGLSLALLTAAMSGQVPGAAPRSVTARFHRPVTGEFTVSASMVRAGRSISTLSAGATSPKGVHVEATGVFSSVPPGGFTPIAPAPPVVPDPAACDRVPILTEYVPIGDYVEVRSADGNQPLAGGDRPELTAWVRFTEDDEAPDSLRLICLIDMLPPSFYSMVDRMYLVPTVELSIHLAGAGAAGSPWVLLRARSRVLDSSGLLDEWVDAWDADGTYLGTAHQLRLIREV